MLYELYFKLNKKMSLDKYNLSIWLLLIYGIAGAIFVGNIITDFILNSNELVTTIGVVLFAIIALVWSMKDEIIVKFAGYSIEVALIGVSLCTILYKYDISFLIGTLALSVILAALMYEISKMRTNKVLKLKKGLDIALIVLLIIFFTYVICDFKVLPPILCIISCIIFNLFGCYEWAKAQIQTPKLNNAIGSAVNVLASFYIVFAMIVFI